MSLHDKYQKPTDPYVKEWMTDKEYKVVQRILSVFFLISTVLVFVDFISGAFLFMAFLILKLWMWRKDQDYIEIRRMRNTYGEKNVQNYGDYLHFEWQEMNGRF